MKTTFANVCELLNKSGLYDIFLHWGQFFQSVASSCPTGCFLKICFTCIPIFFQWCNPIHDNFVLNLFTILLTFVTGFCPFLIDSEIFLHNALPTTKPSAFFSDEIVLSCDSKANDQIF